MEKPEKLETVGSHETQDEDKQYKKHNTETQKMSNTDPTINKGSTQRPRSPSSSFLL
jgi:hypothetical protein